MSACAISITQDRELKIKESPVLLKRAGTKPKRRVKRVNWWLPGLYSTAEFLRGVLPKGPHSLIIEKISDIKAVYIIGTTLHLHVLQLKKKDELNLIALATHLRIVDEGRIHNFHLTFYLTRNKEHVSFTQAYWETIPFVLPYTHWVCG